MDNPTVKALNEMFTADPAAISALANNRVPVNSKLSPHPAIFCEETVIQGKVTHQAGAIGLLNGILMANNLPRVGGMFDDDGVLVGFCESTLDL